MAFFSQMQRHYGKDFLAGTIKSPRGINTIFSFVGARPSCGQAALSPRNLARG